MNQHLQLDGELNLAPGFPAPPNLDYSGYHSYIDTCLPQESPHLYGLHPNAEIGFLTMTSEHLFKTVFELQPRDMGNTGGVVITREDKVRGHMRYFGLWLIRILSRFAPRLLDLLKSS